MTNVELINQIQQGLQEPGNPGQEESGNSAFWISIALFFLIGWLVWDMNFVLNILVVLYIHERGHFEAMRWFGYRERSILFLPLLGAVASGVPCEQNRYQHGWVILAGPWVGLLSSVAAYGLYWITGWEFLWMYAFLAWIINCFNLLPFYPLDGGQLLHETLRNRSQKLTVFLMFLAGPGFLLMGWLLAAAFLYVIGGFVFLMALSFVDKERCFRPILREKDTLMGELTETKIERIRELVEQTYQLPQENREEARDHLIAVTWHKLNEPTMKRSQARRLLGWYIVTILVGGFVIPLLELL